MNDDKEFKILLRLGEDVIENFILGSASVFSGFVSRLKTKVYSADVCSLSSFLSPSSLRFLNLVSDSGNVD